MSWKQWEAFILSSIFIIIQFELSNDKNSTFYRKKKQKYIIRRFYTKRSNHVWLLCCLSDKDILFAWWWWWWWLETVGRDEDGLFEWCLLIIIKAVVAEEGGVLLVVGIIWSLEDVVEVDWEWEAPTPNELFDIVRCCVCLEETSRSAWDWERPNWTLFGRNFDNIDDDGGTDGVFDVWWIWLESVKSDV